MDQFTHMQVGAYTNTHPYMNAHVYVMVSNSHNRPKHERNRKKLDQYAVYRSTRIILLLIIKFDHLVSSTTNMGKSRAERKVTCLLLACSCLLHNCGRSGEPQKSQHEFSSHFSPTFRSATPQLSLTNVFMTNQYKLSTDPSLCYP